MLLIVGCAGPELRLLVANSSAEEIDVGISGTDRRVTVGPCRQQVVTLAAPDGWVLEVRGEPVYDSRQEGDTARQLTVEVDDSGQINILTAGSTAGPLRC